MKRVHSRYIWVVVCYIFLSQQAFADNTGLANDSAAAKSVVSQYFIALEQGDTTAIRTLLGGSLLKRRDRLLSNPSYSSTLQELYSGARFSIINNNILGSNLIEIETEIILNEARHMRFRFQLKKDSEGNYHIHSEEEIL